MRPLSRSFVVAALIAPAPAFAQELPVRFEGVAPPGVAARVRAELDALGHGTADASRVDAVLVRFEASRDGALVAVVTAPGRAALRVDVSTTEPDAAALFALRVSEAVRASVLRTPTPPATTAVVTPNVTVVSATPAPIERAFSFGIGVRGLVSPGGVGPMLLPSARATLGFGRAPVSGLVEVAFSGPSFFGETSASVSLGVMEVSVGGAVVLRFARALSVEGGARFSYLALRVGGDGGAQTSARDGQWAAGAAAALRWDLHERLSLRAGASLGATLGAVDLGIGARTVAEWGRPVAGVEVGAAARF